MDKHQPRRLLTVGHSYVISSNRRLAKEIQEASNGRWFSTVVAPLHFQGNPRYGQLRPETLSIDPDEGIEVIGIPMVFTTRIHFSLYAPRLRAVLQRKFDLVHCWQEPFILCGGQLAWWTPKESALTFHSFQNISKDYPPPFASIERYSIRRSDGWIAAAGMVADVLSTRPGYRDRPHRTIAVGVDVERFSPNADSRRRILAFLGWQPDDVVTIGYLGRLAESKGVRLLMRVLERLDLPWRVIFVGSGELESEVAEWVQRHPNSARHVKNVPHDEVPAYLNAFDMLCAPSQTTAVWREQFGRMLIEAFACGVPVVASDSGEIPNVVQDAGIVLGENDEDAWFLTLTDLISDSGRRADLAARGLERVNRLFTWSRIGAQYVEFFDWILASRRTR